MPSAFKFRLERVLALRRTRRDLEELKLKQITAAVERGNAQIAKLRAELTTVQMQVVSSAALSGLELNALSGYRRHLEATERRLVQQLQEQQRLLVEQRARWTESQRQYKLVEKLRERKLAEFEFDQNREMESFATDMFLARWPGKQKRAV